MSGFAAARSWCRLTPALRSVSRLPLPKACGVRAAPHFKTFSGMDLPYWREYYLLGEAEELAEKIRAKTATLGGCEYIVLNPLNWGMEQLELLAADVLPRVTGR